MTSSFGNEEETPEMFPSYNTNIIPVTNKFMDKLCIEDNMSFLNDYPLVGPGYDIGSTLYNSLLQLLRSSKELVDALKKLPRMYQLSTGQIVSTSHLKNLLCGTRYEYPGSNEEEIIQKLLEEVSKVQQPGFFDFALPKVPDFFLIKRRLFYTYNGSLVDYSTVEEVPYLKLPLPKVTQLTQDNLFYDTNNPLPKPVDVNILYTYEILPKYLLVFTHDVKEKSTVGTISYKLVSVVAESAGSYVNYSLRSNVGISWYKYEDKKITPIGNSFDALERDLVGKTPHLVMYTATGKDLITGTKDDNIFTFVNWLDINKSTVKASLKALVPNIDSLLDEARKEKGKGKKGKGDQLVKEINGVISTLLTNLNLNPHFYYDTLDDITNVVIKILL